MKELAVVAAVLLGAVVFFLLLKFKAKWARAAVEKRLREMNMNATILSSLGIPPLRLWLRNRKGDSWCKVQMDDGTVKWARVRNKIFGGNPIDFFD